MGTINFALMGCGQIASKHLAAIQGYVCDGRVVGVCDRNMERANALAEKARCRSFPDLDTMMAAMGQQIDVVCVLTPTGLHLDSVQQVAEYGKHIVLEKPMALTEQEGRRMIAACQSTGVELFVVKQNRFNRPIRKVHQALQSGRFGKIVMATVRVRWRRDQAYYDRDAWRGTRAFDGGVLANQASHHLDLLQWLAGDVESVSAYTARRLVAVETEDTAVAILRFRTGALGVVEATTATRPRDLEASISILGEGGAVEVSGFATDQLRTWQFQPSLPEDADVIASHGMNPEDRAYAHGQYLANVAAFLNQQPSEIVDGAEALKTVRLIEMLYKASDQSEAPMTPAMFAEPDLKPEVV